MRTAQWGLCVVVWIAAALAWFLPVPRPVRKLEVIQVRPILRTILDRKKSSTRSAVTITDSFNRANSLTTLGNTDTGQTWSPLSGTWGISSNEGVLVTATGGRDLAVVDPGTANGTLQVAVNGGSDSGTAARIIHRGVDKDNYFEAVLSINGTYSINKVLAGSVTVLASGSSGFSAANTIQVVMSGGTITYSLDGTQFAQLTGLSDLLTATKVGIGGNGPGSLAYYDSFSFVP